MGSHSLLHPCKYGDHWSDTKVTLCSLVSLWKDFPQSAYLSFLLAGRFVSELPVSSAVLPFSLPHLLLLLFFLAIFSQDKETSRSLSFQKKGGGMGMGQLALAISSYSITHPLRWWLWYRCRLRIWPSSSECMDNTRWFFFFFFLSWEVMKWGSGHGKTWRWVWWGANVRFQNNQQK